ncbi:hypothetical protein O9G_001948 [Rozella allomycis CSF55]|uniref:Uncharacterized protein n=1 Tax=Rozella allomycis (strain CSF55) TaxID=988480 RepID=A0A075APG8_ROZAC|nr:hypothetical protein O9G_001948 [Rozella allomycis CSF55]|eukprot:EPZ31938.1 hypothetical protein O9G_001948 [Rozella allomycis CSF55]
MSKKALSQDDFRKILATPRNSDASEFTEMPVKYQAPGSQTPRISMMPYEKKLKKKGEEFKKTVNPAVIFKKSQTGYEFRDRALERRLDLQQEVDFETFKKQFEETLNNKAEDKPEKVTSKSNEIELMEKSASEDGFKFQHSHLETLDEKPDIVNAVEKYLRFKPKPKLDSNLTTFVFDLSSPILLPPIKSLKPKNSNKKKADPDVVRLIYNKIESVFTNHRLEMLSKPVQKPENKKEKTIEENVDQYDPDEDIFADAGDYKVEYKARETDIGNAKSRTEKLFSDMEKELNEQEEVNISGETSEHQTLDKPELKPAIAKIPTSTSKSKILPDSDFVDLDIDNNENIVYTEEIIDSDEDVEVSFEKPSILQQASDSKHKRKGKDYSKSSNKKLKTKKEFDQVVGILESKYQTKLK